MSCGGSIGDGYGPMIVSPRPFSQTEIKKIKIAVPGKLTTAYLALMLFAQGIEVEVVPFDQIIPPGLEGKYEAGLIIHEGQLTLLESRPAARSRSWQVVAESHRTAPAVGWECDPASARPRDHCQRDAGFA